MQLFKQHHHQAHIQFGIAVQSFPHDICRDYHYLRIIKSDNVSQLFGGVHHTLVVYQY